MPAAGNKPHRGATCTNVVSDRVGVVLAILRLRLPLAELRNFRLAHPPMPKKWIKRQLPTPQQIKQSRWIAPVAHLLKDENLWHLNRRSVAGGLAVGVFFAFIPTVGQMALAALVALLARVNIAVSVFSTWISNPLTMPVLYFFCYRLGLAMLGSDKNPQKFELTYHWVAGNLKPLLAGCLTMGFLSALLSYFAVRLLWRLHVISRWRESRTKAGRRP